MNHQSAERLSRAHRDATEMAARAQEAARDARLERLETRVYRMLRLLSWLTVALWLLGFGVMLSWRYL